MALETSPARGTRRDDIRPGLRTIGFERRPTIAFRIVWREVVIIRIFLRPCRRFNHVQGPFPKAGMALTVDGHLFHRGHTFFRGSVLPRT